MAESEASSAQLNPTALGDSNATSPRRPSAADEKRAAETIQRNFRGYRDRRAMNGLALDPSTRWADAIKEAQYRNLIRPRPRRERTETTLAPIQSTTSSTTSSLFAQSEWNRLRQIARRAHNDDTSDSSGEEGMTQAQAEEHRRQKREAKRKREQTARNMGLEYWLEMVDEKHRYGSHLRSYHSIWKKANTNDNFFYWLDFGDGKTIDAPTCSRTVLDRDQVRYLSREERRHYLVKVDKRGRLHWAKNDEVVNTNLNFKDSLKGIVPVTDTTTPIYREDRRDPEKHPGPDQDFSSSSDGQEDSDTDGAHYVNQELTDAKGAKKVQYVSAAVVLNHLLKSTTKKNTWIFVADTSMRMYIGIKQSGAFQHSSFLHGARISAAGIIKVKDGQLRSLSPLSGHYRPPTAAFRAFVHSLKEQGVDMSRVSISKSYAVLLGLEGYLKSKSRAKSGVEQLEKQLERVMRPEDAKKKAEESQDRSESARMEKEWLERQKTEKKEHGLRSKLGLR